MKKIIALVLAVLIVVTGLPLSAINVNAENDKHQNG